MRRALLLCIAAWAGCTSDPRPPAANPDAGITTMQTLPLGDCAQSISLYGMASSQPTIVPLSLTAAGVTLCLALDGRDNLRVAHFAASTRYETGETSSFVMSLYDAGGVLLVDGWDVAFGTSPTTVFANLEADMPKGQVTYGKLVVATRAGETTSQVALSLFEPYE